MFAPLVPAILSKGGGFDLRGYLSSLSDGFLFDYTDPDWLRQEPNGPTAVAATNDVIGLALSRRLVGQGGTLAAYLAGQPELRGAGVTGLVGSATAATYNTSSGAGVVSRGASVNDQSFVQFTGLDAARTYRIDVENTGVETMQVRQGSHTAGTLGASVLAGQRFAYFFSGLTTVTVTTGGVNGVTSQFTLHSLKEVSRAAATQAILGQRLKFGGPAGASCDALDDNHLTPYLIGSGDEFLLAKVTAPASLPSTQIVMGKADSSFASNLFWGFGTNGQIRYNAANMATTQAGPDFRGQTIVAGITCGPAGFRVFAAGEEVVSGAIFGSAAGPTPVRIGAFSNAGAASSFFGGNILKAVGGKDRLDLARFRQIASQL